MVLEAVIICIDNSEWMRNSDFSPSRSEAQQDACNLICGTKTRQNLENVVGLITTAGKGVEVRVSLTQDFAKFLTALHSVKIGGTADIGSAMLVAQLALRHRQNKKQAQRIILFVASPIQEDEKQLVTLGSQLKKNKIAVDVVSFGEVNTELNQAKLEAFHKAVNNNDNSTLVTIPPAKHMLSELLAQTPIVRGEAGTSAAVPATPGGFDYVDENVDPELAMTLKLSLETEEAERKARAVESGKATEGSTPQATQPMMDLDDDPELAEALRQSLLTEQPTDTTMVEQDQDDEDEFARAMALSQQSTTEDIMRDEKTPLLAEDKKDKATDDQMTDPDYLSSVFLSLPDIDPNDPEVQALLQQMKQQEEKK